MKNIFSTFFSILFDIVRNRYLIKQLIKRDFQNRYLGSFIGFLWVLIQPTVYIFVMWFVFVFGLKPGNLGDTEIPYHLWLLSGLVPWMFISEFMSTGTNSIMEYAYLIKKVVFRASIIPLIKITTSSIIHGFMCVILIGIFFISKSFPTIYWFQFFYYLIACIYFLLGFTWLTSSLAIFVKDIPQIVQVLVQILFWGTPIIWHFNKLPESMSILYKVNPLFYIIQGYRDSLLSQAWFWEHWKESIFFWSVSTVMFFVGIVVFKKLRPHFADVL